ncbi:MAG TPA: hypothetical protein VNI52_07710 [Sphingobacteriaceae bacterium]|nr:hypothetical protein [Sphingobacteriaceae bacterium]
MKKIKRSFGAGISMLLILLFSVTVLPLDFLHNHSSTNQICTDKKDSCNHKIHITQKASYCWVCAIHFDKTFTSSNKSETPALLPTVKLLFDNVVTGYVAEILYSALRGPPTE